MASYQKFNYYVQDLCEALHNWKASGGGTYKAVLTNSAPNAATWHGYADIVGELSTANGYTAGGATLTISSEAQTSGTEKVVLSAASPTWTSSTGNMGPFRYVVLCRSDSTDKGVVAYWDRGSSLTLDGTQGDTFTLNFDATNGVWQLV